MFNGNPNSTTIKSLKGIEISINYFFTALINLLDFLLLFIAWIPSIKKILNFIYRIPDIIEKHIPFLFGGSKGHRNFITHSVFNPVFLAYIFVVNKICILFSATSLDIIFRTLFFIIGLCFTCHLLSDTMPKRWKGFANIKIYLFVYFNTFGPLVSKIWLYIGAFLSIILMYKFILLA